MDGFETMELEEAEAILGGESEEWDEPEPMELGSAQEILEGQD